MNKANFYLVIHLVCNTAVQGAVIALLPDNHTRALIQGFLTLIAVILAQYDTSRANTQ